MTSKEIERVLEGEAWIEYDSNWYECIGKAEDGRYIFSDIHDGYAIYVSEKALRQSTEFYYTEKF